MKKIVLLCLFVSFPILAQTNAVVALKSYIPFYDHYGVNDGGQKCSIDFFRRPGGAVLLELLAPRVYKFLVGPELPFEQGVKSFKVSQPSIEENNGIVTMSLILRDRSVVIDRQFCVDERCWNSRAVCHLDRW